MRRFLLNRVAAILDTNWTGTYGELARLCGSHPRAVGACVKSYARQNPTWPHVHVYAKRTGKPAYYA